MNPAFIKCPTCRHLVRQATAACPLCRRPFGDARDALWPEGHAILEVLTRGPLTTQTLQGTLDRANSGDPCAVAHLGEQLHQLEERGFVLAHSADGRYWITEQGRAAFEAGAPGRPPSSPSGPVPSSRKPALPWQRLIPHNLPSQATSRLGSLFS
jgi:hypothetical protein